jgi:hypothetical protein
MWWRYFCQVNKTCEEEKTDFFRCCKNAHHIFFSWQISVTFMPKAYFEVFDSGNAVLRKTFTPPHTPKKMDQKCRQKAE